jgi:hypothetical protein
MGKFYVIGFVMAAAAAVFFFWFRRSSGDDMMSSARDYTSSFADKAGELRDSAMSTAHDTFDKARDTVKV